MHSDGAVEGLSAVDNYITTVELEDRDKMEKTWDGKGNGIHISRDVHQRTEEMV